MRIHDVDIPDDRLAEFCRRHRVTRLSLFGSILREDFSPESDVDFLVEFDPSAHVSLFDLGGMLMELRGMVGRKVDLKTPKELSRYFRDRVLREARPLYAA
jgi:uncharacterized protein